MTPNNTRFCYRIDYLCNINFNIPSSPLDMVQPMITTSTRVLHHHGERKNNVFTKHLVILHVLVLYVGCPPVCIYTDVFGHN